MSKDTENELRAILALCRGTSKAYRAADAATPYYVAAIIDALGDRVAALLAGRAQQ